MKEPILFTKYQIVRQIGQGASGEVYLVRDIRLKKFWAMKKIPKANGMSFAEAEVMKNLNHLDLPRIVDFVETADYFYLIIDYIEGVNLQTLLSQGRKFDERYILNWGIQLCGIFAYLHQQNPPIIYCDLKPANLILTSDYRLKLIDFGIALLGSKNQKYGTRGFAAPEQYGTRGYADERSDIYSLGKTLESLGEIKKNHRLNKVLYRCTMENPKDRYQSMKRLQKEFFLCEKNIIEKLKYLPKKYICCGILCLTGMMIGMSIHWKKESISKSYDTYLKQGIRLEAEFRNEHRFQSKVVRAYEKAIESNSSKSLAYLHLMDYYQNMNRTKEGLSALVQYVESDQYGAAQCDEVLYRVGQLYLQGDVQEDSFQSDYILAKKYFSMQKNPNKEGELCCELVEELSKETNHTDWEDVSKILNQLEKISKDFHTLLAVLKVYEVQEDNLKSYQILDGIKEKLIQHMEQYQSLNIHERIYQEIIIKKQKMQIYQGLPKWEDYIKEYVKVLDTNKRKQEVWLKAAQYYEEKEKLKDAKRIYHMLIQTYPKEKDGYIYYGLFLYQEGNIKGARIMYQKVKKLGGNQQYDYKILEKKLGGIYESS
ncbi:MAG: protein kinase [Anaerostipes sp.]|nr:protein kinase [Anaerostipes sp.]